VAGQYRHDGVLLDHLPRAVDDDDPVGVAVVTEPEVPVALGDERAEVSEALGRRFALPGGEVTVDVRLERAHVAAQTVENLGRREARHPVATVDGHPETVEGRAVVASERRHLLAVSGEGVDPARLPPRVPGDRVRAVRDEAFDRPLALPVVLLAVDEQFDSVVCGWVVAGGDHDAVPVARGVRERRRGEFADAERLRTAAQDAGLYGRDEPLSGGPPVSSDDDRLGLAGDGAADAEREVRRDGLADAAPDPGCPEEVHTRGSVPVHLASEKSHRPPLFEPLEVGV